MANLLINQGTNSAINFDLNGTVNTQVIAIGYGTVSTLGTLPNLPGGSIAMTTGTIASLPNIPGGTINLGTVTVTNPTGTTVQFNNGTVNVGTFVMPSGTLTSIPNIPGGTINILAGGTIGILTNGTLSSSGTTTGVGVVSVLSKGTISLGSVGGIDANAAAQTGQPVAIGGTDSGGTIRTVLVNSSGAMSVTGASAGTFNNISTGTMQTLGTVGTIQNILAGTIGTVLGIGGTVNTNTSVTFGTIVSGTINAGTFTVSTGTINAGTVNTGTVNTGTINAGTINTGTINAGTINLGTFVQNPIPTIANVTFGTHGTTGVSIFGTLAGGTGSGAGTEIFLTSLSLSIPSTGGSQDVSIGWGTNAGTFQAGTGLIVRGNFPPGGGIQKTFWPPINSGTQAQLCLFQASAGTVDVNVTYFITASTL